MVNDVWHYPRTGLAEQILGMFKSGLSNALVFFAPRRMGKTEFLLKDIQPLAIKQRWHVLYFSFLDVSSDPQAALTSVLCDFALEIGAVKKEKFYKHIKRIEGGIAGISAGLEFNDQTDPKTTLKHIISILAKQKKPVLLLLDEVQILSDDKKNKSFIAALRTMFDLHKDTVKVIFTGSSQEGLRRMFSKSDAPFFHFGQNLPFPEFEIDFIEHLSAVFKSLTHRKLDIKILWDIFCDIDKIPQFIRSLVERLVLHPDLTLLQAKQELLESLEDDRHYITVWENLSLLETLVLKAIIQGKTGLFRQENRQGFATIIGVESIAVSTLQSAIRTLKRKNIIGSLPERGSYYIDDPTFSTWIEHRVINMNS